MCPPVNVSYVATTTLEFKFALVENWVTIFD